MPIHHRGRRARRPSRPRRIVCSSSICSASLSWYTLLNVYRNAAAIAAATVASTSRLISPVIQSPLRESRASTSTHLGLSKFRDTVRGVRLTPTYGGAAPIAFDGPSDDQAEPVARQRHRFRAMLATFDDAQWQAPTRCDGWAVCDVVAHLVTVDGFWEASVRAGLAGSPSEVLANFDPAAHPPLLIAPLQELSRAELLDRYASARDGFLDALASVRGEQWDTLGESPAGHVPLRLVAQHALWDCWVHERDVAMPLGIVPPVEPDEVMSCLRYAAAIGPHLAREWADGDRVVGTFGVIASAPECAITITVGDELIVANAEPPADAPVLRGDAATLVDALSVRRALPTTRHPTGTRSSAPSPPSSTSSAPVDPRGDRSSAGATEERDACAGSSPPSAGEAKCEPLLADQLRANASS